MFFYLQVFHDVAYKAKDRNDLIAGIDEFLDQVTVLPPGEWDPSIRIEPPKNVPSQVGPPPFKFLYHFTLNSHNTNNNLFARCLLTGEKEEKQHFSEWIGGG